MKYNKTFNLIWITMFSLLLFNSVDAATINGKIYDTTLEEVSDVIIKINTQPQQKIVSKDGDYSINVPTGDYRITAEKGDLYTEENIFVKTQGNYTLDLILWPSLQEEQELVETGEELIEDKEQDDLFFEDEDKGSLIYFITILFVLISYVLFAKRKKIRRSIRKIKKEKQDRDNSEKPEEKEETPDKDRYYEKVISFIKQENYRTTQKEIRKHIPLSEAKISLLLSELENDRKIKRFKKGRSNVVVLKTK